MVLLHHLFGVYDAEGRTHRAALEYSFIVIFTCPDISITFGCQSVSFMPHFYFSYEVEGYPSFVHFRPQNVPFDVAKALGKSKSISCCAPSFLSTLFTSASMSVVDFLCLYAYWISDVSRLRSGWASQTLLSPRSCIQCWLMWLVYNCRGRQLHFFCVGMWLFHPSSFMAWRYSLHSCCTVVVG